MTLPHYRTVSILAAAVVAANTPLLGAQQPPHDHAAHAPAQPADDHDDHADHDDHDAPAGHDDHDHEAAHTDEVKLTADAIRRGNITIAPAVSRVLTPTVVAPGRVAFNAEAMAHVGVAMKGRIVEIAVRAGDDVKKGDALLVIESPELGQAQSDYVQRRTAVTVSESAVVPARQAHARAKALFEKNETIALAEVLRREADLTAAEGALSTANASLSAAENGLRLLGSSDEEIKQLADTGKINPRHTVRAPLAGSVVEREVTLGELVGPENDALLVLADLTSLWVIADVPDAHLASIHKGTKARLRLVASARPIEGEVSYVAPTLDPTTRTGRVRIAVTNAVDDLKPGMFARVDLDLGSSEAADEHDALIAVPEEAIQVVEGRTVVFVPVADEPNAFAARTVSAGKPVGGFVAISAGLKEGEPVVVTGTFLLKADLGKSGAAHEH